MDDYKHIETLIGKYIASKYKRVVEVGAGRNLSSAMFIHEKGVEIKCTDIKKTDHTAPFPYIVDNIWEPDKNLYKGSDCIYSVRPTEEMMLSLINLAKEVGCDLIVYHLGFESYGSKPEIIDCGVLIFRYVTRQN